MAQPWLREESAGTRVIVSPPTITQGTVGKDMPFTLRCATWKPAPFR